MAINPTTLKALIDAQITNETVDFSITPAEVGNRMKDTIDYTTEQIDALELVEGPQGPQGVQGPAGPLGPVGPAGLEWQGSWVSGTSYVADDAVGYDGASWFCILATSGTSTPDVDTTHWALLASQGAVGPQGAQGPTGAQGSVGPAGPQGPAGGAAAQTSGTLEIENVSPYQILSYDLNTIVTTGASDKVVLPSSAPIGKIVYVFAMSNANNFTVRGNQAGSALISTGGIASQTSSVTVRPNESYLFTSLGGGFWKSEAIGPNLQQTYNNGNTMVSGNFKTGIFDLTTGVSVENTSTLSKTTVETTKITLTKNASGLKTTNILQATTPTQNVNITLPDASGTVALKTYNETVILLSYDGTSFTYTNVINELGVTITFSTFGGVIVGTLSSSVLTEGKTIIWASSFLELGGYLTQGVRNSGTSFLLALTNTDGSNTSIPTSFTDIPVRIQVYN